VLQKPSFGEIQSEQILLKAQALFKTLLWVCIWIVMMSPSSLSAIFKRVQQFREAVLISHIHVC